VNPSVGVGSISVGSVSVVIATDRFDDDVAWLRDVGGFALDAVLPADDPSVAHLSSSTTHLVVRRTAVGERAAPVTIRIARPDLATPAEFLTSPGGTVIELVPATTALPEAHQELVVVRGGDGDWVVGRAGMQYRDLLPGRWGGRFIVSHIRIPDGGPVPDTVHFHDVRFQLIVVKEGWVRVVYEDQGEPFVMERGDCVLQPPHIRHRVLENSPGFEVIEVGCPAVHPTRFDHALELPTPVDGSARDFSGQRFVHHRAAAAAWAPWHLDGFECCDSGIAAATGGLADVHVVRVREPTLPTRWLARTTEFAQFVVLAGACDVAIGPDPTPGGSSPGSPANASIEHRLTEGGAIAVPESTPFRIAAASDDLELLEVVLPARPPVEVWFGSNPPG
jgi:mannose-6-phosphate isomerase-like protein (cupin superfamily)